QLPTTARHIYRRLVPSTSTTTMKPPSHAARIASISSLRRPVDATAITACCTTCGTPAIRPKHVVDVGITVA
ncbi:hypothetical protein ACLOJK_006636, partial [Asimina triloba]